MLTLANENWQAPDEDQPPRLNELKRHPGLIISVAGALVLILVVLLSHRAPPRLFGRAPSASPPRASLAPTLAYDRVRHELVMFGGVGNDAQTWVWKGGQWLLWHLPTTPSARFGATGVWDPNSNEVVIFGGVNESTGKALADLWAWNGSGWTQLDPGDQLPAPMLSQLTYDKESHLLTLFLSDDRAAPIQVWAWSQSVWHRVNNLGPSLTSYSVAFDPIAKGTLITGPDSLGNVQSWIFRDNNWTEVAATSAGFNGETIVEDTSHGRVLGLAAAPAPVGVPTETQLWLWNESAWRPLDSSAALPKSIQLLQVVEDADHSALLALVMVPKTGQGESGVDEVWTFTGSAWMPAS